VYGCASEPDPDPTLRILSYANAGSGEINAPLEASLRIVVFDDHRIGTWEEDGLHDVTDLLTTPDGPAAPMRMRELIERWPALRPDVEERRTTGPVLDPTGVRLRPPSPYPRSFLAAPLNYAAHGAEMKGPIASGGTSAVEMGFFVKAGGSLSGATDPIELPARERRFDHEGEIAFVIGTEARGVSRRDALDHVFGYALILDLTMRMTETEREERTMRKSFQTFSPSGPWLLTADEVPDPTALGLRLWVNDDLRQEGTLADLILDVPGLIEQAAAVVALEPGDLYATGTPAGVGPIEVGDRVRIDGGPLGSMELRVEERAW
jgi:2-keto-4-pentenoate hydratase/2-oxohepta-3-ene-1,7-dioic acid hydratase in catechol pathway